jgi:hypothetical protein
MNGNNERKADIQSFWKAPHPQTSAASRPKHYQKITASKNPKSPTKITKTSNQTQQNNIKSPTVRSIPAKFPSKINARKTPVIRPFG